MTKRRCVGKRNILDSEGNLTPIPHSPIWQTNHYTDRAIQAPNMHVESSYTYSFTSSIVMSCTTAIQNILTYRCNFQIFKNKESELNSWKQIFLIKKKCYTNESFLYLALCEYGECVRFGDGAVWSVGGYC